jgi:hypothetical protein
LLVEPVYGVMGNYQESRKAGTKPDENSASTSEGGRTFLHSSLPAFLSKCGQRSAMTAGGQKSAL